jgi:MerR family mercuric resistance operon transcriptional regulator/MerR family copper efflux transcriptional regulator
MLEAGTGSRVKGLRIGEVAEACGVSVDTVRHYERRGLLPAAFRTDANQRMFPPRAINRVMLVRRGVQFGFSLKELAAFMKSRDKGVPPCHAVRGAAEHILERVEAQLAELTRRRRVMRKTLKDWDARLASAPANQPARLLETLPPKRA